MEKEKESLLKRLIKPRNLIGLGLGLLAGYAYYHFVGCQSGTCPITSKPWSSMLWGGLMGYLVADLFERKPKKETEKKP